MFHSYRRMEVTRDLQSLNLLANLMVLHRQILFSLAIAEAILMKTTAEQVPSLHRVAPRYLGHVEMLINPLRERE